MSDLLFYVFAAITAGCALGVVLNRNSVHASFCLLLSLLGTAGIFVLLEAYLLAALLVLVYAGAVVALFVFIIMLLGKQGLGRGAIGKGAYLSASLAFILLLAGILGTFGRGTLPTPLPGSTPAFGAQLKLYAQQLFTVYLLPVQIVGFLLLIAMLGVIVLAKRDNPEAKQQQPGA